MILSDSPLLMRFPNDLKEFMASIIGGVKVTIESFDIVNMFLEMDQDNILEIAKRRSMIMVHSNS
jgi:hypothetical protein